MGRPANTFADIERKFVEKTDGCWLWKGKVAANGYGQTSLNYTTLLAHRVIYELHKGPIPEGLVIDHLCRNRACVNPAHLEVVTQRVNSLRAPTCRSTINSAKTHCISGHPLSGPNLYVTPHGARQCKTCRADRQRRA